MRKRLVSVVIVEFYSLAEILSANESIKKTFSNIEYNFEIIISSNSLYDLEKQLEVKKEFSDCIWIFNPINGGFAYAMNKGLRSASGDYFVIVNPDVIWDSGIDEMIAFLDKYSEVGLISPAIFNNENHRQDSFREYITPYQFVIRQVKRLLGLNKRVDNITMPQTVDWVIGAFIMIKRNVFVIVDGLDEHYFLYCEDMDWCTRIRKSGFEIVYYPNAHIIYEGTRAARKSYKYAYIFLKSLFYYWKKFGFVSIRPRRRKLSQLKCN